MDNDRFVTIRLLARLNRRGGSRYRNSRSSCGCTIRRAISGVFAAAAVVTIMLAVILSSPLFCLCNYCC